METKIGTKIVIIIIDFA